MLIYYRFKNFQSFTEWTEVNFSLKPQTPRKGWERVSLAADRRLSTAMTVFGANGSGKTALLKPIAFMHWFVSESFGAAPTSPIPVPDRLLDADNPSEFEAEFADADGTLWRYELAVTQQRVLREELYRKQSSYSYVFKRSYNPATESYDIKQQGFGFAPREARKVRPTASLIATAAQYGVDIALRLSQLNVHYNVNIQGRSHLSPDNLAWAAKVFQEEEELKGVAVSLLSKWDFGLSDIAVSEVETINPKTEKPESIIKADVTHVRKDGRRFVLPLFLESSGTQSSFVLLALLLPALRDGGLAVVDEMESDLHPDLIEPLLTLFDSEISNPNGAQLLFTSHTTKVLEFLGKAQVMFVEKSDCVSSAFRGDQVQGLRVDDNLRAKYETGAIGATPEVF